MDKKKFKSMKEKPFVSLKRPPSGFFLQKDVYTSNILYANTQLLSKVPMKWLPFRTVPSHKPDNPSKSLKIVNEKCSTISNEDSKISFSLRNRPKKLINSKLSFPLPKIIIPPLTTMNFDKALCKKDLKIKYMEDDLNISSRKARKIIYNYKNNIISTYNNIIENNNICDTANKNYSDNENSFNNKIKNILREEKLKYKKYKNKTSLYFTFKPFIKKKVSDLNNQVNEINNNLRRINTQDKENRKIPFKDNMFATQINVSTRKRITLK